MNCYERAVIEAARALGTAWKATIEHVHAANAAESQRRIDILSAAVEALEEYERTQAAAGIRQIEWALVVAGDELQGGSGAFYPVLKVKQEYVMGRYTGKRVITVQLKTGPKDLVRPHGAEPFATVRRSPDGAAVDEFVNVFSSGEA